MEAGMGVRARGLFSRSVIGFSSFKGDSIVRSPRARKRSSALADPLATAVSRTISAMGLAPMMSIEPLEERKLLTAVSMGLTSPIVTDGSGNSAVYTFSRDNTAGNLPVYYRVGGSAPTSQFSQSFTGEVTIPDGQSSVTLAATPLSVASGPDLTLTLALTTPEGSNYSLASVNQATMLAVNPSDSATDLFVGPGQTYSTVSAAVSAATSGDYIDVLTSGTYSDDTANINANNITIRGIGQGYASMVWNYSVGGYIPNNKGIIVFNSGYSNLDVENMDLEGARISAGSGNNAAGIRAQGTNLNVTNCRIYNNQDGILGGAGNVLVQYSDFSNNGTDGLSHQVYFSNTVTTLTFQYNTDVDYGVVGFTGTNAGHLFKSRAAVNHVLYNDFDDGSGAASYEVSFPNGGQDTVIGNIMVQGSNTSNTNIIDYASEAAPAAGSFLYLVNNTAINDKTSGAFVHAINLPSSFNLTSENNIFAGPGTTYSMAGGTTTPTTNSGNIVINSVANAGFVNPSGGDYHLSGNSSAIGAGVSLGSDPNGFSITPTEEYIGPAASVPRQSHLAADAGAYDDYQLLPDEPAIPAPPTNLSGYANSSGSAVTLNWTNNDDNPSDNTIYIERSDTLTGSFSPIASLSGSTATYTDSTVTTGQTYYYEVYAENTNGNSALSNVASVTANAAFSDTDIGSVSVAGSASLSSGVYTVSGAGSDIYGSADQLNFAHWALSGDGSITAKISSEGNTNSLSKVGLMMRSSLAANSPEVSILRAPGGSWYMESRAASGGSTSTTPQGSGMTAPVYLQLVQSGSTVTGYYSYTGAAGSWTELGSVSVSLGSTIYAGLAVSSHNTSTLETATFSNVSVTGTPASPSVTATPGDGYNTLSWNAVSDATSYNVYRSTTPGGEGSMPYASDVTGTSMTDIGVSDGTAYYYKVTAVDSAGESTPSGEVSATPSAGVIISTSGASTVAEGSSYSLSISLSGSEVLSVGSVSVDWGDGDTQSLSVSGLSVGGGVITATHTYDSAPASPEIQVSTSVSTPIGTQDFSSSEQSLGVTHTPPTLSISGSSTATAGSAYTLDLSGSEVGDETISQWAINWGDGTTPQVVSGNPSSASYTYANGGSYVITATATDTDGTYDASGSVTVAAGGITVTPLAVQATVGQAFSGVLATIADTNGSVTPDDFSWTINWGDGSSSDVGSNSSGGADRVYVDSTTGLLTLAGTHTYSATSDSSGPYTITITLSDGTNTSSAATAATVTQLFAPAGQTLQADAGGAITGTVATFGSVNTSTEASDYTATIQWNSSSSSTGVVSADGTDGSGNPLFSVAPETYYIYALSGNQTATIIVTDTVTGESFSFPLATTINQISITPATGLSVEAGDAFSSSLATFSTTNIDATLSDFSSEISWGSGDSSDAVITADGTNSSGDPIFSIAPASGYVYNNAGPQTASVSITDDITGLTNFISVPIASETEYAVHIVNTTVLAEQLTTNSVTYNPAVGSPDSNGWVYVDADDEYDAIANAVYADAVSTNGNEYQFGEGFASDAFTLSPASPGTSAADLNWYLNLNNQEGSTDYSGYAKVQVAPVMAGFYVYDDNDPTDSVSPGNATTQTLDVVPDSDGNAAVDLNAILSADTSATRQDTLRTLSVNHDSEIVASGSLSADDSDTLIDLPSGYTQYTLKYGFDLNGDGDLNNGAEIQRVITIDIASHSAGSLAAQNIDATAGQTFTGAVATFNGDSIAAASNFSASITWGDGVITAGIITGSDGIFEIDGTHAYSAAGTDTLEVSVWPTSLGASNATSDSAVANVRDGSLAADWNFGESYLNETPNAVDTSGNGNDATLANGATFDDDSDGTPGLSLNGNGEYATVVDNATLDPTNQLTVAAAIEPADWTNAAATILQKGDGQYTLAQQDGQLIFSVNTTDGLQQVFAPLPSTDAWHSVIGTYDSVAGQITLNIDGTAYIASASGTIVSSSGPLTIGGNGDGLAADSFNGLMEEVSIYNSVPSSPIVLPVDPSIQNLKAAAVASNSGELELTWNFQGDHLSPTASFDLYYAIDTGVRQARPVHITSFTGSQRPVSATHGTQYFSYTVIGLKPNTTYDFWMAYIPGGGQLPNITRSAVQGKTSTPALSISGNPNVTTDSTYTLDLPSTVSIGSNTIQSWQINWGDGHEDDIGLDPATYNHVYTVAGTYTITAEATYKRYGPFDATDTVNVTVSSSPTPTPTPVPTSTPTGVAVAMYGGTPSDAGPTSSDPSGTAGGTLPLGEMISWTWVPPVVGEMASFTVTRTTNSLTGDPFTLSGSVSVTPVMVRGVLTYQCSIKDPTPPADVADPDVYYYSITAHVSGQTDGVSSPTCAPQLYMMLGHGNTDGGDITRFYDANVECELHWFVYTDESGAISSIESQPSSMPIALAGISFGGGSAVDICWQLAELPTPRVVSYLALFDPVCKDLTPDPNDPPQAGDTNRGNYLPVWDESSFLLPAADSATSPTYGVRNADIWWQPYSEEVSQPEDGGVGYATGTVGNLTDAVGGTWVDHPNTGTYHTSQVKDVQAVWKAVQGRLNAIDWTLT